MSESFTLAQQQAIAFDKGNCLVSAGAGCGKTRVLTHRVFRLLKEKKATLKQLLVLTFTDKAAKEMKDKVRTLLMNDPSTKEMAEEVESSAIETFDAFARSLVVKYHYELGLPSDIDVIDNSFLELLKHQEVRKLLDEKYATNDPAVLELVKAYTLKTDENLTSTILGIMNLADSTVDANEFYEAYVDKHFSMDYVKTKEQELLDYLRSETQEIISLIKHNYVGNLDKVVNEDLEVVNGLLACHSYDDYAPYFEIHPKFVTAPKNTFTEEDNDVRDAIKKRYFALRDLTALGSLKDLEKQYLDLKPYYVTFISLAQEVNNRLAKKKAQGGLYSFADIASLARKAVELPALKEEIRSRFQYIMIDEYQDTNDLQESFINSLADNNVFEVGDIKQSIYLFRNANPDRFAQKFHDYSLHKGGTLINLDTNFRSREGVLTDINELFMVAMRDGLGGIDYQNGQALKFGRSSYSSNESLANRHYEHYKYNYIPGDKKGEIEATIIANDILKKVQSSYPLSNHAARFEDFAILIRRKVYFSDFRKIFAEANIPLEVVDNSDGSNEDVILVFSSILRLISVLDKGQKEIEKHCYVSIKRSFLFDESDEDLYQDVKTSSYQNSPLFTLIRNNLSLLRQDLSLEDVCAWVLTNFPFREKLGTLGLISKNYEELNTFAALAKQMDRLNYTLQDFAEYLLDRKTFEIPLPLESPSSGLAAVKLMTIHASKGLEFPVVYLPDLDGKFNQKDAEGSFLFKPISQILLPNPSTTDPKTFLHYLATIKMKQSDTSEEMRLFYVAMTRAEEKIIFVSANKPSSLPVGKACVSFSSFLSLMNEKESAITLKDKNATVIPNPLMAFSNSEKTPITFLSKSHLGTLSSAHRASKISLALPDPSALAYGTSLHEALQTVNFESKDTSFISDEIQRHLIDKVLSLPLFQGLKKEQVYQEYAYYDESNGTTGSIDLLLVYPDHEVVVDYKSKDISDPLYKQQVETYQKVVERLFTHPCKKYLLSLSEMRLEEIQ